MIHDDLAEIYTELNDLGRVSTLRKNSICQKLRLQIVRDLVRIGPDSGRLKNRVTRLREILDRDLDLAGVLRLSFEFPDTKAVRLAPTAPKPTPVATDLLSRYSQAPFDFVIHGSHADSRCTDYSDLDCSVFVAGELSDQRLLTACQLNLAALDRHVQFVDPCSHHSSFVFFAGDLECYPQSFMPLSALSCGLANFAEKRMHIRADPDLAFQALIDAVGATLELVHTIRYTETHIKAILSTYFICLVMLTQFLTGDYPSKQDVLDDPDAFCRTETQAEVFEICCEIRKSWRGAQQAYMPSPDLLSGIARHIEELADGLDRDLVRHRLDGSFKT